MVIFVSGINYRTAPVEIRERLSFDEGASKRALRGLVSSGLVREGLLLSTCNRTEIYGVVENQKCFNGRISKFIIESSQINSKIDPSIFYQYVDTEAVRHLFRVAAGLDSMVIGEAQILGQVKQAYSWAVEVKSTGSVLNKLFHHTFCVGKRVRTETRIGEGAVSVGSVAADLAKKIFRELSDKTVLIIGAGKMALQTVLHLKETGVKNLLVSNRTMSKVERIAIEVGGEVIPYHHLERGLVQSDVVISSTASAQPILTAENLHPIMMQRKNRPLFLIDIAVPRDISVEVRKLYNVYLYNIDDLQSVAQKNLGERKKEIPKAEHIVSEEVGRFMAWYDSLTALPTIQMLQQHFEEIRRSEVKRNRKYFAKEDWEQMELFSKSLLRKFLHYPIMRLKSCSESRQVCHKCTVRQVFGLEEECHSDGN
ncbi:glutamyl-tRNA reductase [candidate division KSB1 bacterium]|nr:MAG: glutamyl-tRNA reductase [candidate division KSB1 bacterium]